MAQFARGRGAIRRGRGRGRGNFTGRNAGESRTKYKPSRLDDLEESHSDASNDLENEEDSGAQEESNIESETSSEAEEEDARDSYASLLRSLKASTHVDKPVKKRRKLDTTEENASSNQASLSHETEIGVRREHGALHNGNTRPEHGGEIDHEDISDEDQGDDQPDEDRTDDEELVDAENEEQDDPSDPFDGHFNSQEVSGNLKAAQDNHWRNHSVTIPGSVRKLYRLPDKEDSEKASLTATHVKAPTHMKARLQGKGNAAWTRLANAEKDIGAAVMSYRDVVCGVRTTKNSESLRGIVCLHALNHVFKTRDRVLRNNVKLARETSDETPELRDQGFTRPKVLFILPTRSSCVHYIESLVAISSPEQQENKSRFLDSFASPDDSKEWGDDKLEDFRELFSGNDDDTFRIGVKFTRKTMKFFSQFYTSDIIFASPLGLRTAIETPGKNKSQDSDYLSSIEIIVVDQADALLMQNWQHLEYIFSRLNILPKDAHGCDFTRVRTIYLDNLSRYFRQTILLSSFLSPEMNSLSSTYLHNHEGLVKYTPSYSGAMLSLPVSVPSNTSQMFLRFNAPTPSSDPALRFTYFTTSILPSFLPTARFKPSPGTLVFVPSYFSFLRLQTHLSTDASCTSLSFASITEYTSVRDVARTRSHFANGRYSLLLYTERAHHFRRFGMIRGVKRIIFFGVPENPLFWPEICRYLGGGDGGQGSGHERGKGESGKGRIKALFSRWDVLKLERIVGTDRVGKMVKGQDGDVFEFV